MFHNLPTDIQKYIYKFDDELEAKLYYIKNMFIESQIDIVKRNIIKYRNTHDVMERIRLLSENECKERRRRCVEFMEYFEMDEIIYNESVKEIQKLKELSISYCCSLKKACKHNKIVTMCEYDGHKYNYETYCKLCEKTL
tara:strand:- start:6453 stop:6872 length:420 start_codon:yes stop_codon:yes gene_type:complete